MSETTSKLVEVVVPVVLGWALGIATAEWTDWRRDRKKLGATRRAISAEIQEVALRLLGVINEVEMRRGRYDRDLLQWMLPHLRRYSGPNPKDGLCDVISGLLQKSDPELAAAVAAMRKPSGSAFFPEQAAPYTSAVVNQAHDLGSDYAQRVLDILSHIRMFNGAREQGLYFQRLTFAGDLSADNRARADSERRCGGRGTR